MNIIKNYILPGKNQKPILLDFGYKTTEQKKPIVLFVHGFKSFKDWGHYNKVMVYFIENDFGFVKFNFSHNGGTMQEPVNFPDLEAFGNNNYTKELNDMETVLDWITTTDELPEQEIDKNLIYLIGHSRGGGISIIKAFEDKRIKKLVTWAAVSNFLARLPKDLTTWKNNGVVYIENVRTQQQMPLYYQFVEDNLKNKERFNIENATKGLSIPFLIVHGTADEAVGVKEAQDLKQWDKNAEVFLIEGSNHAFGAKHPFDKEKFPADFQKVIDKTIAFLK
ncbi:MAG: alpha/beta hydrolase fold domain-containing protein [Bacteroidia bacterium]